MQAATAGMSREEEVQFWRERFAEAVEAQAAAREKYGSLSMVDVLSDLSPAAGSQPGKTAEVTGRR